MNKNNTAKALEAALASLERQLYNHPDAEVKNIDRLRYSCHQHTVAMCKALTALIQAFSDKKIVCLVEAELLSLGFRARPEDIVAWIESVGIFVIEIKSHTISGIRRFENNVPYVMYNGVEEGDVHLVEQPRDFAYKLRSDLERYLEDEGLDCPALYFAGWLPNVSQNDLASRNAMVSPDKVWLSDMLERDIFLKRLGTMKNLTRGDGAERSTLPVFVNLFGCTSIGHPPYRPRAVNPATLGHLIDQRNLQLKRLTAEQETLAFSPQLVRGPKVIRGVAGSGKTVVLVNAVADVFIRWKSQHSSLLEQIDAQPLKVLVVCFNRALTPYLKQAIWNCFDTRKPVKDWSLSHHDVEVINIDRLAWRLGREIGFKYDPRQPIARQVQELMATPACQTYDHIFIDEGQDIDLDWYPLLRTLAKPLPEVGPSIIVFYDEAQNLYGVKRPGVGDIPSWKEFLGETPNPRGLRTVMRVGHRNTNEILTFSFNMLLGAFSERDPRMKEFANLNDFETTHRIPDDDPTMNHPNAGKPCVEKINPESSDRFYKTNFAIHKGPKPLIHKFDDDEALLVKLQKTIIASLDPNQANVDPKDILVMAPDLNGVSKIKEAFTDIGIDWHSPHGKFDGRDLRDQPFFQEGKITISTIKSAKGYTAHVVHLVFVDRLIPSEDTSLEREQQARAMFHVACTRATLSVEIWGQDCALLQEAQQVLAAM